MNDPHLPHEVRSLREIYYILLALSRARPDLAEAWGLMGDAVGIGEPLRQMLPEQPQIAVIPPVRAALVDREVLR